ncbi:T9SS type A sorting domain-containing protein [bacterium]|nr:T9SS type A sorting domain-containing protein [bacterium]
MFTKRLLSLLLIITITGVFAKKEVIGPDLRLINNYKSRSTQSKIFRTLPDNQNQVSNLNGELQPLSAADKSFITRDGERCEMLLEYVNWPIISYGGFGFDAMDSALVWFRPYTECTIERIHIAFSVDSDWSGHTANLQLYSIKDDWHPTFGGDGTYDFSQLDLIVGDNGPHDSLLLEIDIPVTDLDLGIGNIYRYDLVEMGHVLDVGASDFALVLGVPADVSNGQLYYTPFWSDRGQYHGFKYYHDSVGWKSRLNFVMMVTVDYYGDPAPFITEETDLDDVYLSDDPGPYAVSAKIIDWGTDFFMGALTAVELRYSVNGGEELAIDLCDQISETDSIFTAHLSGFSVGDFVEYFFYAADNGAGNPDNNALHESTSSYPLSFSIREANPNASVFLVDDNNSGIASDHYAPILDAGGWVFDYWDVAVSGDPSPGILGNYETLVWVQGNQGPGILDKEEVETSLAGFLDAGGNLFLSASDYIGYLEANFEGYWMAPTPDSFLQNYLHVSLFVSDANVGATSEMSDDTLYTGVSDSPISDAYTGVEFVVDPEAIGFTNWADEVIPDEESELALLVYSNYLDEDWVGAGVVYDGDYKMVFLPWQFEAIVNNDIQFGLMANILDFFGNSAVPRVSYEGGNRYAQAADAGDIKIYGSANDVDGSVVSMGVDYSLDGGTTWSSVTMTNGEAEIPALAIGDTCYFVVIAVDNDGLIGYSEEIKIWKIDLTPSTDILYVGSEIVWWDVAEHDTANYFRTETLINNAGLTVEYYDLDDWNLMDTRSILDQYQAVIWNAYADWEPSLMPKNTVDNPLSEYEGTILYSSEEMLGTWNNWENASFGPGDFIYDIMGVEWYGSDYAPDSIIADIASPTGSDIPGFILEASNFMFGNLADIVDPIGSPGPYEVNPPFLGWLADSSFFHEVSASTPSTTFLSFSMMMMPDDIYESFITNWLNIVSVNPTHSLPTMFKLAQNYPNPFNPVTTIRFDVPEYEHITLSVFNLLGQKVIDLVNEEYQPGYYDIQWNGIDLQGKQISSGLYIYRLTAGQEHFELKMVYLK